MDTDVWVAVGAVLSGLGSILTGLVALRLARREGESRRNGRDPDTGSSGRRRHGGSSELELGGSSDDDRHG